MSPCARSLKKSSIPPPPSICTFRIRPTCSTACVKRRWAGWYASDLLEQSVADPLERLRLSLRSYIEFGLKHPNHYMVTFVMTRSMEPQMPMKAHEMGQRAFNFLRTTLALCADRKLIEIADVEATAQILWASIHGLTSLLIARPKFPWVERDRLIDTLIETSLAGLRAGSAVPG